MKNLVFIIPFVLLSFTGKAQVSREQAINIIANEVVGVDSLYDHHLYSRYEKMYFNDTLWLDGYVDYYIAPYNESWVFFVDLMPTSYWAHPCLIIFFDVSNSDYVINDDDWPPDHFLGSMTQFFEEWEWILSVGTESVKAPNSNNFRIIPNPFINEISIKYENNKSETFLIKILDVSGKPILTSNRNTGLSGNGVIKINTSDIKPGMYFIKISTNNKTLYTEKIVK